MINTHFVSWPDVFILAAVWFETEINDNDALKRTGWVYDLSNFEYPIDPPPTTSSTHHTTAAAIVLPAY